KNIPGLSNEIVQKLSSIKPESIGQAGRVSGITPAAISVLSIYIKKASVLEKNSYSYSDSSS
ncbi:MAG: hypothetical protein ACRENO_00275, partial [Thermodesulfobacteriota bacterium]